MREAFLTGSERDVKDEESERCTIKGLNLSWLALKMEEVAIGQGV